MKVNTLTVVTLIAHSLICNSLAATIKDNDVNDIAKVLPVKYEEYKAQLTGNNDVKDCNAICVLVSEAKAVLDKQAKSASEKENHNRAYYATWRLCLRMRQKSKDVAVQKLILKEWNNFLGKNDEAVPFQIYALSGQLWDRSLLTDDFWKLLQQTNKKKTIAAVCFAIYQGGNAEDMKRLKQKRYSGIDAELQEVIQNAINWMNYKLSGDKTNPGPAAAPPIMDMKD